jgi:hypothetical protein
MPRASLRADVCAILFVFALAFVLRRASFPQSNGDCLTAAFDLAAFAAAPAPEFAVLELVHHAAGGLSLTGRFALHASTFCEQREFLSRDNEPSVLHVMA